jgi:hypothetical protein
VSNIFEDIFFVGIGILLSIMLLISIYMSGNLYIGNNYQKTSDYLDFAYEYNCGYGQACSVSKWYFSPFFYYGFPLLDYYKAIGKKNFIGCSNSYGNEYSSSSSLNSPFNQRLIHNIHMENTFLIEKNYKNITVKNPTRNYDYSIIPYKDSLNRTCDSNYYNAIVFSDNGRCQFTSQEIKEFVEQVKSKNKELMILICNDRESLVATPFNLVGIKAHFDSEGRSQTGDDVGN